MNASDHQLTSVFRKLFSRLSGKERVSQYPLTDVGGHAQLLSQLLSDERRSHCRSRSLEPDDTGLYQRIPGKIRRSRGGR